MAKGKGKPASVSATRVRRIHGPKRHMFKELKPMVHVMHERGLLNKYNSEESFVLACAARGNNKVTHADWMKFSAMSFKDKQEYFKSIRK